MNSWTILMGKVMPCSVFKGLPHECLAEVQQTVYINKNAPPLLDSPCRGPGNFENPSLPKQQGARQ